MRVLSLFSGGGGGDLGLLRAGFEVVAHSEIEPHARAVLRARYEDTELLGDVRLVDGTRFRGRVDVVAGGSPCQDLSVAGKRAGLAGERSSLFYEQIRIWRETDAGNLIWENVPGALSSHKGRDFALVLGAIVGGTVPVPEDGWRSAGVAAGPRGVAAWRLVDLQYFGPPQRRRRLFVVGARAGGVDPEQVLLERAGVSGDPETRREAWEAIAAAPRGGSEGGRGDGGRGGVGAAAAIPLLEPGKRTGVSTTDPRVGIGIGAAGDPCYTLQAGAQHGVVAFDTTQVTSKTNRSQPKAGDPCHPLAASAHPPAIVFDWQNSPSQGMAVRDDTTDALRTSTTPAVPAFNSKQDGSDADEVAPTLLAMPHDKSHANGGGQLAVCVTGERTHALTSEGADASEDGTGRGTPIVLASGQANAERSTNGVAPTLTLLHEAPIVAGTLAASGAGTARPAGQKNETDLVVVGTLTPGAHPGGANGQDAYTGHLPVTAGVPRRLMPIECERLQGWPDEYTRYGVVLQADADARLEELALEAEEERDAGWQKEVARWEALSRKVAKAGGRLEYELSDSARYRIIGNGIGAPHFHWIGLRMREAAGWD